MARSTQETVLLSDADQGCRILFCPAKKKGKPGNGLSLDEVCIF